MSQAQARLRTPEEIASRLRTRRDVLGFEKEALVQYLPYALAQPYLKPDVDEEDWEKTRDRLDPLTVRAQIREYMDFAWMKVGDHRGISASRSVLKLGSWCWLIGRDDLAEVCEIDDLYPQYGAPILRRLCEALGLPWPHEDDEIVRMTEGLPCRPDCDEGCGSL